MNRITLLVLWISSITATFALGWVFKPSDPSPESSPESAAKSSPRRSSLKSSSSGNNLVAPETGSIALTQGGVFVSLDQYSSGGTIDSDSMARAMADMRKENDPLKRRAMFSQLMEKLTPDNAKAALSALREGRGDRRGPGGWGRGEEERLLLNAWGRIDGPGAIAELEAMEEARRAEREAGGENEGGRGGRGDRGGWGNGFDVASVLSGWAMSDASAAMEYANGVEDERARGMMTGSVIRGVMVNGVDEAVAMISSLPAEDESRGRHMWMVAEEVLEGGTASAAQWVTGLSDDSLKDGAMRRIASSYSRENLQEAISWVEQHQDQPFARGAVTEVAERWAESDPQAVIEWADDLPEETQRSVFVEAMDEWTERDAVAASAYLDQMPDSPLRDSAIQGFANELAREDPESAVTWASTISDQELRTETLSRVAREYYRRDRTAAEAWLPNSGLTAEQQQAVTESRGWDRGRGRGPGGGR